MKLITVLLVPLLQVPLFAAPAGWYNYRPTGCCDGQGTLADVVSRCDAGGRQRAFSTDRVTYCHEATHQVNGRIHNDLNGNGKIQALYVGDSRTFVLPEPKVTLVAVRRYVFQHRDNNAFQTYFIQAAAYHNDRPLYVLDEWVAYCNGSRAAKELGIDDHGSNDRCIWFCHYAQALLAAVRKHDPGYQSMPELVQFIEWQTHRVRELIKP